MNCGVYHGLSLIKELGYKKVELNIYSSIVIEILDSNTILNMECLTLAKQIHEIMEALEEVKWKHIYGEVNQCAYTLAKFEVTSRKSKTFEENMSNLIRPLVIYDVICFPFSRRIPLYFFFLFELRPSISKKIIIILKVLKKKLLLNG